MECWLVREKPVPVALVELLAKVTRRLARQAMHQTHSPEAMAVRRLMVETQRERATLQWVVLARRAWR
jgi:hypothetical protein